MMDGSVWLDGTRSSQVVRCRINGGIERRSFRGCSAATNEGMLVGDGYICIPLIRSSFGLASYLRNKTELPFLFLSRNCARNQASHDTDGRIYNI